MAGQKLSNVTDITPRMPHAAGPVRCFRCGHEWVAVRHVSTAFPVECPKCSAMMGFSWDSVTAAPAVLLGGECCGQTDGDGVCMAPACAWGDAQKLAHHIICLAQAEMGDGTIKDAS